MAVWGGGGGGGIFPICKFLGQCGTMN
jgi:hypothetical protein